MEEMKLNEDMIRKLWEWVRVRLDCYQKLGGKGKIPKHKTDNEDEWPRAASMGKKSNKKEDSEEKSSEDEGFSKAKDKNKSRLKLGNFQDNSDRKQNRHGS